MICFYHNDLDGHCSGAIVRMYEQNYNGIYDGVFIESDYSGLDISQVTAGETVYIVDYSFTENTVHYLYELIDRGCEIIWIDHHQSSLDVIENHPDLDNLYGMYLFKNFLTSLCLYLIMIRGLMNIQIQTHLSSEWMQQEMM